MRGAVSGVLLLASACAAHGASVTPLAPTTPESAATVSVPAASPTSVPSHASASHATPLVVEVYERACQLGSGRGCNDLGVKFLDGEGVDKDERRAVELLRRGCDLKFPMACANLGYAVKNGIGTVADPVAAEKLFESACDANVGAGCNLLGDEIHDRSPADARRAFDLFLRACTLKSPAGCVNAGGMYDTGEFVNQDRAKAASYYRQGCDADFGIGCTGLATIQLRGEGGLTADADLARQLYEKGCRLDAFYGCATYGTILTNGELPDPRHELARTVLKRACDAGNGDACAALADLIDGD